MAEAPLSPKPRSEIKKTPEKMPQATPNIERPRQPLGEPEQRIADRIKADGDPDRVLEDVAARPREESGVRRTVEVNGQPWHYIEYGNPEGQPILNVHGWLGSSAEGNARASRAFAGEPQDSPGIQELRKQKPESAQKLEERVRGLEGKYHVIAPELPGFGTTEALPTGGNLDAMADGLADFQKATNSENAIVFGTSMGGILGIKMAARHPESVKAVVAQGTMTQPEDMAKFPYIGAQVATWGPIPGLLERTHTAKPLFALLQKGSKDFKIADAETKQRILSDTMRGDVPTAVQSLREIGHDIETDINRVECPVVIMDGVNGDLVPIMRSHEVTKRFYPDTPLSEKVPEKVVFLPIGGHAGEQGHNLVNTFPEAVATWVDYVNEKVVTKPPKPEQPPKAPQS